MTDLAVALAAKKRLRFKTFGKDFANALLYGTIQSSETGAVVDELGLYWLPRTRDVCRALLKALTRCLENTPDSALRSRLQEAFLGPEVVPSARMAREAIVRSQTRLLAHLDIDKKTPPDHATGIFGKLPSSTKPVYRFPAQFVWPMLFYGFTSLKGGTDETAELAAHIQFIGGCRSCEPFHIWVQDIQFRDGRPYIFLHHPEDSNIRGRDGQSMNRASYLKVRHQRGTRNKLFKGAEAAGWKGLEDEKGGALIQWLPIPGIEERLGRLLLHYIRFTRPRLMQQRRAKGLPDHPFLLVSSGELTEDPTRVGAPYTRSAYYAAWARAVRRIAKKYNAPDLIVAKSKGTTTHGSRHFYGSFLKTIGADNDLIRRCMRHLSERSQIPYTKLTNQEVNEILKAAAQKNGLPDGFESTSEAIKWMTSAFAKSFSQ
ncbi:site-specific integrase [Rhizobium rhizogenes]|uniref:site-specific integrase n=1 Tax=Rhizobium rhizogenes TaxID=359 RepID=UPI0015718690|nr:site-specific integrase [Rhizobium rhizogenes]NTG08832.1 site-specific integrase [Rhizobium rhizogenes]